MKKRFLAAMLVIVLILTMSLFILTGCNTGGKTERYQGVDLTEGATITASDSSKNASKLTDGSDSTWTTKTLGAYIEVDFGKVVNFNTIVICEPTDKVTLFEIYMFDATIGEYKLLYTQDRIDKYRMCAVEDVSSSKIKIIFNKFDKKISISNIEVFNCKDSRQDFVRQSYFSSSIDGTTNLTTIQTKKDDPDFKKSLDVLTDVILIGLVRLTEDATLECAYGIDNIKEDIRILKELTNGKINVHVTIMTGVKSGFKENSKAMVKLVKNDIEKFKENLKVFVSETDVDGIDYDWEYPQLAWEWNAYSEILIATKAVINGRQLSVALWPYGVSLSKEARAVIDTVNIMAYDQFDERGDHSSIYECGLGDMEYFLGLGFSKNQLLLGIPFYGRTTDKAGQWPLPDESYGKWNNFKEEYTYTDDKGTHTSSIYLNGYAMVRDKTALAIAYDLAGIMIFSFTCDLTYSSEYSLHKAVEFVLDQRLSVNK